MEVQLEPVLQARLEQIARVSGRTAAELAFTPRAKHADPSDSAGPAYIPGSSTCDVTRLR